MPSSSSVSPPEGGRRGAAEEGGGGGKLEAVAGLGRALEPPMGPKSDAKKPTRTRNATTLMAVIFSISVYVTLEGSDGATYWLCIGYSMDHRFSKQDIK